MQGTEGRPNGNDAGNVPPTPPGFSRGPGAGFPQGPTSMPPGGGIYYGQPTPYSPGDRPTAPYPLYQSPQQQPVTSDETHQTQQPTNHPVEPGVQGTPDQPISFPPQNANIPPGPPMAPQQPGKPKVLLPVLSIVLLIAVIGGAAVWIQRDKVPEIDQRAVDNAFVDGKMATCELGDEFYDSVAWKDVYQPNLSDEFCSGWFETAEGDIAVELHLDEEPKEGRALSYFVSGWDETKSDDSNDPWCMMNTDRPGLEDLQLTVAASCEPLYPIASKLSDLSDIAAGEAPSNDDDVSVDTTVSVAGQNYTQLLARAGDLGDGGSIESLQLEQAKLALTDVDVTPFGESKLDGEDSEICVDATLNIGRYKYSHNRIFDVPGIAVMNPAGQVFWLEWEEKREYVEEYEDIDLSYCGEHTGHFRDATYLLLGYDPVNHEFDPVWKFDINGEEGI